MTSTYDIAVIGGGVMGLGLAGELAGRGMDVVLLEKEDVGREASYASGGMIAPFMELETRESELLSFGRKSLEMYKPFINRLEEETGEEVGLSSRGTLYVARHDDQQTEVEQLHEFQRRLGVETNKLDPVECRRKEPLLSSEIGVGLFGPREMWVNNRRLTLALLLRCRRRGVDVRTHEPVVDLKYGHSRRIKQCRTSRGTIEADQYINAAGAWSSALPGLSEGDRVPVRPVKGQAVAVQLTDDFLPQFIIRTPDVYCVPHPPERMVLGATSEERGFDQRVTAGAVLELIHDAAEVLPGVLDQPLLETWAGFRPASRDNRPVLGPAPSAENLWYATGHYRSGVLLLPVTVQLLADYMESGCRPEALESFRPDRFVPGPDNKASTPGKGGVAGSC
jgi:glycine oxidase